MTRLFSIAIACISSILFIIPAVIVLQYAVFKQRCLRKTCLVFLFALYATAVFSAVGSPTVDTLTFAPIFNFIPLVDVFQSPMEYIKNTVLNILLFMPLGFLLPAIWKKYRSAGKTVLFGLSFSVVIELLQIFTFRITDVDDLLTNTLGTLAGYSCWKALSRHWPKRTSASTEKDPGHAAPLIHLIAVFGITFFLQPLVSYPLWEMILSGPLWKIIR